MSIVIEKIAQMVMLQKEAFIRATGPAREQNRDRSVYYSRMADTQKKLRNASAKRVDDSPVGAYLLGGALEDQASSAIGDVINKVKARKSAYKAAKPWMSYIPFTGWGAEGERERVKLMKNRNN